ncbi:ABC transporter ATP-binding protein [Tersicoccus sp. MR15.9]|uniref:ABC transporter ATP-binding protein n=1 Tax=Tersicoccus mangrovi TaxID=3121635 RepID=UPI002FE6B484
MYELASVTKTYQHQGRSVRALDGVDLTIRPGEMVAIQGPTGGGKSTLLQMLGALDRPSSGSVHFGGDDLARLSGSRLGRIRATEIGFVFQNFNLIPTLTAAQNVETALVVTDGDRAGRAEKARQALADVGLAERADHLPSELSGGQQQRVAIARALVKRPSVLLADEPTGNLDEAMRDDIMGLLERQWGDVGLTLIMVTHDSSLARRAQRRLRIDHGRVTELT